MTVESLEIESKDKKIAEEIKEDKEAIIIKSTDKKKVDPKEGKVDLKSMIKPYEEKKKGKKEVAPDFTQLQDFEEEKSFDKALDKTVDQTLDKSMDTLVLLLV